MISGDSNGKATVTADNTCDSGGVTGEDDVLVAVICGRGCAREFVGHEQCKLNRLQSPHFGLTSSHFFLLFLHVEHPVWTRLMRTLAVSEGS